MSICFAIAGWTIGSIALGLVLGQILRASAKHKDAEEKLIASLHITHAKPTRRAGTLPGFPEASFAHKAH